MGELNRIDSMEQDINDQYMRGNPWDYGVWKAEMAKKGLISRILIFSAIFGVFQPGLIENIRLQAVTGRYERLRANSEIYQ